MPALPSNPAVNRAVNSSIRELANALRSPFEQKKAVIIFMQVKIRAPFWLPDRLQHRAKPVVNHKSGFQKRGPNCKITKKRMSFRKIKATKGSVKPKSRASAFIEKEVFTKYI